MKKNNRILILILLLLLIAVLLMGSMKHEYHVDEVFSYILSNSYDADMISHADHMWGQWIDKDDFEEFITVQSDEGFSYKTVYNNNTTDCHPPLYYWLLHTICSFFPNQFSKWFGLSINAVFYLLTILFLFFISKELFADERYRYITILTYGLSPLAIDDFLFIRMYMLSTFFVVLLSYLFIRILRYGSSIKRIAAIWIVIYLGAMTHYYFTLFAFFAVLVFLLLKLPQWKHEKKNLLLLGTGSIVSVLLMILSYPVAIEQATGSSTNRVGNEVSGNALNLKLGVSQIFTLTGHFIERFSYVKIIAIGIAVVLAVILGIVIWFSIRNRSRSEEKNGLSAFYKESLIWLSASFSLTYIAVAFIGGHFVYTRYILHILPLFYLLIFLLLERFNTIYPQLEKIVLSLVVIFAISNFAYGAILERPPMLYKSVYQDDLLLEQYKENSVVVITPVDKEVPTGDLMKLVLFHEVYMDPLEKVLEADVVDKTIDKDGACILYIDTDQDWTEGYDEDVLNDVSESIDNKTKTKYLCDGNLGKYFLVTDVM